MSNTVNVLRPQDREQPVTVRDLITVNLALCDVLEEECRLMDVMQIGKVGELQERKLRIVALLERYTRYLNQHPEVLAAVTPEERQDLRRAGERFRAATRKNYDRLLVARAVNGAVVKCVTQELSKYSYNPTYNAAGNVKGVYRPISVTLNQTI